MRLTDIAGRTCDQQKKKKLKEREDIMKCEKGTAE